MSVTTTTNPVTYSTQDILKDYELHHSGASESAPPPNPNPPPARVQNSPTWDTEHRRVPSYRPINRNLDQSVRRVYNNNGERTFLSIMFTGVLLEATAAKWWGATGGKVFDRTFRYRIGGEF